jgi:putative holliday junction resolvase
VAAIDITPEEFARMVAPDAALYGLDLGTKTIGIAVADTTWTVASALTTIRRSKFSVDAKELLALAAADAVGGFVLGLPLEMTGREGPRAQATRAFVRTLAPLCPLPVFLWDERLSTVAAERVLLAADMSRKKRAAVIDKSAAAFILQGALDRLRPLRAAAASRDATATSSDAAP